MTASTAKHVLADIWRAAGHPEAALETVDLTGGEPVLPSSFRVGTAAQTTIAAAALAASELWRLRTGRSQRVSVDMRSAAIEFRSERYLRVDGKPPSEYHDAIAGLYRCGDGRWLRLHTNLPHHRDGVLALLGCPHERTAVQRALDGWQAEKFETAAAEAGLVVTAAGPSPNGTPTRRAARSLACPSSASIRSATPRLSRCPRPSARLPG
jgi:crotonobetainyl-CoA:carnitine CoA-transferase CaiB-like acyl-CoA transferase